MIKRKILSIVYFLFLTCLSVFVLAGCGSSKDSSDSEGSTQEEEGTMELYYLNAEENGFYKVSYILENDGNPLLASYEIINKLSETESSSTNSYKPAIFDGVVVNSIVLEDGEETVDMGTGYRQLDASDEILLRTAVVKSLVQIEGVDSICFTVNGDSLLGSDDNPVGSMTGDSFILEEESGDLYSRTEQVMLYYANMEGNGLVEYQTDLETEDNIPIETKVLTALGEVPDDLEVQSPLPSNLVINSTQIENSVCYVDLSREIENELPGVEEEIMVYAMVNSITSLGNATSVQFTVEGETVETLRNFEGFNLILTNDYSFVR